MLHSANATCAHCAKIDFDFFTKPLGKHEGEKVPLGVVWPTILPDVCQVCQLLRHCIECSGDKLSNDELLRGVYTGHELQLYIESKTSARRLDYSIRLCEPTSPSYLNEDIRISAQFDINELKRWLELCDTTHRCLPSDTSLKPLPDFRLIDVVDDCIVQPKQHVKYCVLSYVWGDRKQPLLTLSNKEDMESKNFLQTQNLPKTIEDAMKLCREIDCRYLWVDSLCIIQDSNESKYKQINSMADVYSRSFLAFIAAAGDDSDAGLSPYGARCDSNVSCMVRTTTNGTFVASLSPQIAAQAISKSTWASRGWTLQEYALSRRVLFFTGSYAFLRCEKGLQCEDFGLGFSNCFEEDRKWDLPLPPFYRRVLSPHRHYPITFSRLLAQFLRRTLRFEQDVLNAFTGILTRMEGGTDAEDGIGEHLWGLPSKDFGAALQWSTNAPWPSEERTGFPTWSWAGWKHDHDPPLPDGGFHDIYDGYDSRASDMSVLTWRKYHDNKSIHMTGHYNLETILSRLYNGRQKEGHLNNIEEALGIEAELRRHFTPQPFKDLERFVQRSNFSTPLSHHIFLWASCGSLYVDRLPKKAERPLTWDFPLRIKKDHPQIGSIRLKPEWRKKAPDYMPFMVSTAGVHSQSTPAHVAEPTSRSFQLKFKLILMELCCEAMLVPVYKRIHVSHTRLRATDWARAKPRSQFISLI